MNFKSLFTSAGRTALALTLAMGAIAANAQSAPIRILVGFPPGGSTDLIARQLALGLQTELGRTIIVENRAGAGGQIAAQAVKTAKADGSTLFLSNAHTVSIVPVTMINPGFDVAKDFAPVGLVTLNPDVFAVNTAVAGTTGGMKEFAKWAQANPGKANVGVPAPGSAPEFAVNVIGRVSNVTLNAVPYRGDAPLVQDLVAGQVASGIGGIGALLPYVEAGKLRILAVNGSTRLARMPDVPTYAELGIKGLEEVIFTGVFAPAGTPAPLVQQYNAAIAKVVNSPAFSEKISSLGVIAKTSTPEELGRIVERGRVAYGQMAKDANYKPQ